MQPADRANRANLRAVVNWLGPFDLDKRPQCGFQLEDVLARAGSLVARQCGSFTQEVSHLWDEQQLLGGPAGSNRNMAIVKRMRGLFDRADLRYKSQHKFRHGRAVYTLQHAKTITD